MKQVLRDQLENCKAKKEPNAVLHMAMNATGSHLWGICPQNEIFTKWCTVESLSANILGFNDRVKKQVNFAE